LWRWCGPAGGPGSARGLGRPAAGRDLRSRLATRSGSRIASGRRHCRRPPPDASLLPGSPRYQVGQCPRRRRRRGPADGLLRGRRAPAPSESSGPASAPADGHATDAGSRPARRDVGWFVVCSCGPAEVAVERSCWYQSEADPGRLSLLDAQAAGAAFLPGTLPRQGRLRSRLVTAEDAIVVRDREVSFCAARGHGNGLCACRSIVRSSGGRPRVSADRPIGRVFQFTMRAGGLTPLHAHIGAAVCRGPCRALGLF
jgi:hypothetical protein